MGRHLGIDFLSMLVDLGSQVGRQNRAKIFKNGIGDKKNENMKRNKVTKKAQ